MKTSNLILTFIIALAISFTLQGQSNTRRVISINNDDESIHVEYEDGEVAVLKIDGVKVRPANYASYQHIIDKYRKQSSPHHSSEHRTDRNSMQSILLEKLTDYLVENENMDRYDFEFKLTPSYLNLNGRKINRQNLYECLEIFDKTAGYSLTTGSYFHVEISANTKSVSLSINE